MSDAEANIDSTRSDHYSGHGRIDAAVAAGLERHGTPDQRFAGACGKARIQISVREATVADIDGILSIGKRTWDEMHDDPWNPQRVAMLCATLIEMPHAALFVLHSNGVCGAFGLVATENPCSGVKIACELFWFIGGRGRGHGLDLLRRAEAWSKSNGCARLKVNAPGFGVASLLARSGYKPAETIYQRAF